MCSVLISLAEALTEVGTKKIKCFCAHCVAVHLGEMKEAIIQANVTCQSPET